MATDVVIKPKTAKAEKAAKPVARTPQPEVPPKVERIAIKQIVVADTNPRLKACESKDELQELAQSIARSGLLQPIGVRPCGKGLQTTSHELVWGSRRLQACRDILGWTEIDAVVVEGDDAAVAEKRAVENLHRRAMNPLEELLAVESLMNTPATSGVRSREVAVKETAERMGRSTSWVRDRLYFARLGDKARKMLAAGEMTAPLARELAKVVDHGQQEEIIRQEFRNTADEGLPGLGYLREICNRRALSLHQVPWNLEAKVGDTAAPACTACPHNTDNDKTLFEHDGKKVELGNPRWVNSKYERPTGPFCTNAGCYASKQREVEKAIAAVIKKAEWTAVGSDAKKAPKGKKEKAAKPIAIEFDDVDTGAVPECVNMDALEARIEQHNEEAGRSSKPAKAGLSQAEQDRKWKEQEKKRREKEAQRKKLRAERADHIAKTDGAMAALFVLAEANGGVLEDLMGGCVAWSGGARDTRDISPKGAAFLKAVMDGTLTFEQLDALVAKAFRPEYGDSAFDKLSGRFGKQARPYLHHVVLGTPLPVAPAKPAKPAKGKGRKGGGK